MQPCVLQNVFQFVHGLSSTWPAKPAAAGLASASSVLHRHLTAAFCTSSPEPQYVVDCVVVGAGVIGLACARAAALAGMEVVLLEQEASFGTATSSRHSEVIHAGIYYPQGSLKAQLCVEGKQRLYEYCRAKGIAHRNLGKLIVATDDRQVPKLRELQAFAAANGVSDLELLTASDARDLEPALAAAAALLSPSTGIIDSHSYMAMLLADAEAAGAVLATHSRVLGVRQGPATFSSTPSSTTTSTAGSSTITSSSDTGDTTSSSTSTNSTSHHTPRHRLLLDAQDTTSGHVSQLCTRWLINSAGLHAQSLRVQGLSSHNVPQQHLAKGNYFSLSCKAPFSRLIYPLPVEGGLGVHLTLDLAGQAKFGPDVQWVAGLDYSVDPARAQGFYPEIRRYYPSLPDGSLQPSYCGIRPKISGPGQPAADFWVAGPAQHGVPGLVNLFGMESPGLTSSLAVAEAVLRIIHAD